MNTVCCGIIWVFLEYVDHQQDDISVDDRAADGPHHALLELVFWKQHTGRVGIDDLAVLTVEDTLDAVAGRLSLWRRDAELLTEQLVQECALSHVWHAEDADEASTVRSGGRRACGRRMLWRRWLWGPRLWLQCQREGVIEEER